MDARKEVERLCDQMTDGQDLIIAGKLFRKAYACGWPSIYNSHEEAFLSNRMGSGWGEWFCEVAPQTGDYRVRKRKGGERRTYVDPDRAHLFRKDAEGFLVHISTP